MEVVKRKFKKGDKVWCIIRNKYGITNYHRPCTVAGYSGKDLLVTTDGYSTQFFVDEIDFDLIDKEAEAFYATVNGKYCKCIPCNCRKNEWIAKIYNYYTKDKQSTYIPHDKTICVVIFDGIYSKMGIAICNKKDDFDLKTGIAIAYARAKGIEIPKEVLA